jgi:hypothetical protein
MNIELPEDLLIAIQAHAIDPVDFPPAGSADPGDVEEWLRDRERVWDRASRVLEKMDALMAEEQFPAWFGCEWHQLLRHPWATRLEWAVEEAEKTVG